MKVSYPWDILVSMRGVVVAGDVMLDKHLQVSDSGGVLDYCWSNVLLTLTPDV
jgi:hypothetical protein